MFNAHQQENRLTALVARIRGKRAEPLDQKGIEPSLVEIGAEPTAPTVPVHIEAELTTETTIEDLSAELSLDLPVDLPGDLVARAGQAEAPAAANDAAPSMAAPEASLPSALEFGVAAAAPTLAPAQLAPAQAAPVILPAVSPAAPGPAPAASARRKRDRARQAQPKVSLEDPGEDAPVFLPDTIVTGSIPYISGDPDEIAWHDASLACATEKLRITYSLHEGRVWYIAAPAAEFAGHGGALNPLADALPGMPGHRGDGGYQAESLSRTVTVFRAGNTLKAIVGDHQITELYRADHGEPDIYKTAAQAPWVARDIRNSSLDRVLWNRLNAYAWGTAIVAAALAAISVGVANGLTTRIADTEKQQLEVTREVLKTVQSLQRQPLREKVTEIRGMYARVVQNQGVIQAIRIDKAQITAKIDVPSWVADSEVTALAAGGTVTATAQTKTITRGKPKD